MTLGEAVEQGWSVSVQCERHRAGLKSVPPCRPDRPLDLPTLMATLGPYVAIEELQIQLKCPTCGTPNIVLKFRAPKRPAGEDTGPKVLRRMGPAKAGEHLLGTTSHPWIVVVCERCGRRGEFKRETLLAKYGPEAYMTGLYAQIAADAGCADAARGLKNRDLAKPFPCVAHYDLDHTGAR